MPLTVGQPAPEFELMNQDRLPVKLSDLRGKTVVLLFYPMDFSPTCTDEHCDFGPQLGTITGNRADVVVFGVNADHPFCHAAYRRQYDIPYDLLSDPTRAMIRAYDMFAGVEPFNCAKRGTVVVGPDGVVRQHVVVGIGDPRSVASLAALASA